MDKSTSANKSGRRRANEEDLNNRLFFRIFRATNNIHTKGTKALASRRTTTQQWSVLGALSRPQASGGMSVGELSQYLSVSRQNLTGILGRLERDGTVERISDTDDRRLKRARLTPKGERLWEDLRPLIHGYYDKALKGFSVKERILFTEFITRLQENLDLI